jgi:hypothetical protein
MPEALAVVDEVQAFGVSRYQFTFAKASTMAGGSFASGPAMGNFSP